MYFIWKYDISLAWMTFHQLWTIMEAFLFSGGNLAKIGLKWHVFQILRRFLHILFTKSKNCIIQERNKFSEFRMNKNMILCVSISSSWSAIQRASKAFSFCRNWRCCSLFFCSSCRSCTRIYCYPSETRCPSPAYRSCGSASPAAWSTIPPGTA